MVANQRFPTTSLDSITIHTRPGLDNPGRVTFSTSYAQSWK